MCPITSFQLIFNLENFFPFPTILFYFIILFSLTQKYWIFREDATP